MGVKNFFLPLLRGDDGARRPCDGRVEDHVREQAWVSCRAFAAYRGVRPSVEQAFRDRSEHAWIVDELVASNPFLAPEDMGRVDDAKQIIVCRSPDLPQLGRAHFKVTAAGAIEQLNPLPARAGSKGREIIVEIEHAEAHERRKLMHQLQRFQELLKLLYDLFLDCGLTLTELSCDKPGLLPGSKGRFRRCRLPEGLDRAPRAVNIPWRCDPRLEQERCEPEALVEQKNSKDFVRRVVDAIARNEGHYTSINWDDAGAGISVGRAQFNQKKGELPSYLRRCQLADPARFHAIFGAQATRVVDEEFIRAVVISKGSELGGMLERLLAEPTFQLIQDELLEAKVMRALRMSSSYGHTSELFVAQVADIANQIGWGGVERALKISGVVDEPDERKALEKLRAATAWRQGAARRNSELDLSGDFSTDRCALDGIA